MAQEAALELYTQFNCCVVFLGAELKEKYYKGGPLSSHTAVSQRLHALCSCCTDACSLPELKHYLTLHPH